MHSDEEIMFHRMMADDVALEDDVENHMMLANLLESQAEVEATPKRGRSERGKLDNKNRQRKSRHFLLFNDHFFHGTRQTMLLNFVSTLK